jgi:hypothetical protein
MVGREQEVGIRPVHEKEAGLVILKDVFQRTPRQAIEFHAALKIKQTQSLMAEVFSPIEAARTQENLMK